MKVCIIGAGYVGLNTAVVLACLGHDVCCIEKDQSKLNSLRQYIPLILEQGLPELLADPAVGSFQRGLEEFGR